LGVEASGYYDISLVVHCALFCKVTRIDGRAGRRFGFSTRKFNVSF
jgi:hypothetical protein